MVKRIKRDHLPENKNGGQLIPLKTVLCLATLMLLLAACQPDDSTPTAIESTLDHSVDLTPGEKNEDCPELDSKLYELFLMDDPTSRAEQLGFRVVEGKVQVLLVLAAEDTAIPEGFDLDVGTRAGDQVQVFAPFKILCDLANTEEVIAIRQPMTPVLEGN